MKIGELFLNLGIKGTEKTVGAITNVKKGLSETASMSLEAKAGILAAMYALERLFAASGKTGTGLTNFNTLLGVSAQTLQQYQYAARQMGVSNEEVEGSFKSLQSTMTKTLMGEAQPKGLARVSLLTGGISPQDIEKFQKQPQLLLQKLQEYAKKESNVGLRNEVLKSFGLGDNMISALTRQAFKPEVLKKAPTYSDNEVGSLNKANIAWSNLGSKIEMAFGHFNAKHGVQLVSDISKITTQVIKLIEAFTKLAEKLHLFDAIAGAFKIATKITEGTASLVGTVTDDVTDPKKRKNLLPDVAKVGKQAVGYAGSLVGDLGKKMGFELPKMLQSSPVKEKESKPVQLMNKISPTTINNSSMTSKLMKMSPNPISPKAIVPGMAPKISGNTQNNNVNINNNFQHPGTDAKKTGNSMKQAVQQAYRQMSAQAQGT